MMEKVNYIHKWILGIYPLDFHNGFYINHDGFYINHDGFKLHEWVFKKFSIIQI